MSKKKNQRIDPELFCLPLVGADSHAHLTSPQLFDALPTIIEKAKNSGVATIGNVLLGPKEYQRYSNFFKDFPQVFFLLGIHPCDALHCTDEMIEIIKTILLTDDKVKAVGEIGFDFYWKETPPLIQEEVFRKQLSLAKEINYPVSIHSRDAAFKTIQVLEAEGCIGHPILWHCFSGDALSFLDRILGNGWSVSIAGPVSYNSNKELHDVVSEIPLVSLLLETDCPYLTPNPWRGEQNEPAFIVFTAKAVAEIKKMSLQDVWKQCGDNTRFFYGVTHPTHK